MPDARSPENLAPEKLAPKNPAPEKLTLKNLIRLKKRSEFLHVARRGRRHAMPGLVLQAAYPKTAYPETNGSRVEATIRIGFTASKKVGNAVARNRAKRRLRALAHEYLRAHAKAGHDYVLIARAGTLHRSYQALQNDLQTALTRVHEKKRQKTSGQQKPKQP